MGKVPAVEKTQSVMYCGVCGKKMIVNKSRRIREGSNVYMVRYWTCANKCADSENGKTADPIKISVIAQMQFDILEGNF